MHVLTYYLFTYFDKQMIMSLNKIFSPSELFPAVLSVGWLAEKAYGM